MSDAVGFAPYDLVFCYDPSLIGKVISYGTFSSLAPSAFRRSPSHVAVICDNPHGPGLLWTESTMLSPRECLIQKTKVAGVQVHRPYERLQDYLKAGGQVACYRLPKLLREQFDIEVKRDAFARMLLEGFVRRQTGYDLTHAVLSGTRLFSLSRLMPWSDLSTVFCSELCAFAEMWLGLLPWQNQQKFSPGRLLRTQVRSGVRELAWCRSEALPQCVPQ